MLKLFARSLFIAVTLIVTVIFLLSPGVTMPAMASSHREAPLITGDPLADNTDVYAFRSTEAGRDGYVTLIWNHIPFEAPPGGPQFYKFDDNVLYDIHIDNTGDGVADITYRFRFKTNFRNPNSVLGMAAPNKNPPDYAITSLDDPNYNEPQTYSVTVLRHQGNIAKAVSFLTKGLVGGKGTEILANGLIVPPNNIGSRTTPNYEALAQAAVYTLSDGRSRAFAGQRDEGFYIDLGGVFDLLNLRSISATGGTDSTAGFNVNSLALEVPIEDLTSNGGKPSNPTDKNAVIGVWSTASRRSSTVSGGSTSNLFTQVSRLGSPLVNEVVIPLGLKDTFNASQPSGDSQFASFVTNPQLATLLQAVFGITIPPTPRNDLVQIFATGIPVNSITGPNYTTFLSDGQPHELLRLNLAIAPTTCNFNDFTNPPACRLGILGGDVAGFPNGRRVGDDVVDIALRAVAGGTPFTPDTNIAPNNTLGDGVDHNDVPYLDRFPYLGTPNSGNPAPTS